MSHLVRRLSGHSLRCDSLALGDLSVAVLEVRTLRLVRIYGTRDKAEDLEMQKEWNEYTRNAKEHQQNTYRGYGGHTAADEQEQRGDEKEERIDQAKSKFREQPVEMIQSLDNVKRVGDEKGDTDPEGAHRRESIESGRAGGRRELRHNEAGQVDNLNKTMIVRRAFSGVAKDARATHNDDNLDKTSCRVDIVIIVSYQRSDVGGGCRLKV